MEKQSTWHTSYRSKPSNKPKKPKKWSHQSMLEEARGKIVALMFNGDSLGNQANWRRFELIESDAYALLVRPALRGVIDKSALTYAVMKHEIRAFHIEEPA